MAEPPHARVPVRVCACTCVLFMGGIYEPQLNAMVCVCGAQYKVKDMR